MGLAKTYSRAEFARHNLPKDLWISINGRVYDVTHYQDDHPGGEAILRNLAGKDATNAFFESGHSTDAVEKLNSLSIGVLAPGEEFESSKPLTTTLSVSVVQSSTDTANLGGSKGRAWSRLLGGLILGIAVSGGSLLFPAIKRIAPGFLHRWAASLAISPSSFFSAFRSGPGGFWVGVFMASATHVVGVVMLGFTMNRAFMYRHWKLEDYPRSMPSRVPIHKVKDLREPEPAGVLSRDGILLTLVDRQKITCDSTNKLSEARSGSVYRLRFKLPDSTACLGLGLGQHIKLSANIDGVAVHRSYTPISDRGSQGTVELLVKVYPEGRMGNFLRQLPLPSPVEARGPFGTYRQGATWQSIGCIAGGTGITPIYQVLREWGRRSSDRNEGLQATLLYGSETQDDILLRTELDSLVRQNSNQLRVHYVLGQPPPGWTGLTGWITREMIEQYLPSPGASVGYLICGPDGMVRAVNGHLEAIQKDMPEKSEKFIF